MARGNLLLGKAKGKLGSVVFAQANGEQITRSKPESVKNPKSTGQNTQRAILATIAKDAALLSPIIDHSFANIRYGADSVRYFRKINLGILRNSVISLVGTNYNLTAKGGNAVPNYLKVSEGSLPAFKMSNDKGAVAFYMNEKQTLGAGNVSVADFKAAYPYLQGGDQLTLVRMVKTAGSLADGDAIFALKYDRIVFAPNAFDDSTANIMQAGDFVESFLDLTKTTNVNMLGVTEGGAGRGLGFTADTDNTYAAALILSRKVNGKWQRSTQFMEMCEFDDAAGNAAAIASYGATASVNAQTEYLNQAEKAAHKYGVRDSYGSFTIIKDGEQLAFDMVNAGAKATQDHAVPENAKILLYVQGFGTPDNPVRKVELFDSDSEVIVSGTSECEYAFNAEAGKVDDFKGKVTFKDGSFAICSMIVSLQNP